MTALPMALTAWEPWLAALPGELVGALGPWLPRLRLLVGALERASGEGQGDPDGVSGIGRRGSYEQLLLSEWALAEVAPLEFLRRAAQGEHLFLQRRRRAPAGSPRTVLLLDCGPDLLGAPRLAQLALLLVFARRAADAGATLTWGVLQDGKRELFEGASDEVLRRFLVKRSRRPATAEDVTALVELVSLLEDPEEIWLLSAPRTAGLAPDGAGHIAIDEPIALTEPSLVVTVAGRAAQPVRLPLPEPALQAGLLRKLAAEPAIPVPVGEPSAGADPGAGLFWSQDGRRLLSLHEEEQGERFVRAWHVPPNPRSRPGRPRRLPVPSDVPLVAVGFTGRRFHWVTTDGGRAKVHEGFDGKPREVALPAVPTPGWFAHDGLRPALLTSRGWPADLLVLDATRTLWRVLRGASRIEAITSDVLAVHQDSIGRLLTVARDPVSGLIELSQFNSGGELEHRDVSELGARAFGFFGWPGWMSHRRWGLLAVGDGVLWTISYGRFKDADGRQQADNEAADSLLLDPGAGTVVGVSRDPADAARGEPGLLVLDAPRRTLSWHGISNRVKAVTTWSVPPRAVAVNRERPQVGAILEDGSVSVRMVEDGAEVLAVTPADAVRP